MKWLLLLVLAVLVAVGAQQWFKGRQDADLQRQLDQIKTQTVKDAEAAVGKKSAELAAQEARLKAAIADMNARLKAVDQRLKDMNADLAKQAADRKRLVDSGTMDEVLELGRRLGYTPRAAAP